VSDQTQPNTTTKKRRWEKAFLTALRESGNIRVACEAVGIERSTAYDYRNADIEFKERWERALEEAADLLELEARRRAYEGVRRLKFDRGTLITIPLEDADGKPVLDADGKPVLVPYVEHEYSDTLLIFLLKGARPEKYRERAEVRHSGKIDVSKLSDDELQSIIES
jgi:hypothetical protein